MSSQTPGTIQCLLSLIADTEVNAKFNCDLNMQAALLLKLCVNQCWSNSQTFMNQWATNQNQSQGTQISDADKTYLKSNIFCCLDSLVSNNANKTLIAAVEHMIYNIAQVDYQSWNGPTQFDAQQMPIATPLH